jgi:hypothetical protein
MWSTTSLSRDYAWITGKEVRPRNNFQRRGPEGFGEVSATDCRSLPKYFLELRFWIASVLPKIREVNPEF